MSEIAVEDRNTSPHKKSGKMVLDGFVLLVMSMALYNLGIASVFFISPLLLFAARYGKKNGSILILLGVLVCFLLELIEFIPSGLTDGTTLLELALAMYIPMSLSAAGIIWIYTGRLKLIPRIFLLVLPSVFLVVMYVAVFLADRALFDALYSSYQDAFVAGFGQIFESFGINLDLSWFFLLFLITLSSMILPVTLTAVCANCFIYETVLHSKESNWEDRVKAIEFPSDMVWAFIVSWALILLFYFISVPIVVEVIVLNIGLMFCVVYAIQGFAVVFTWLKRSMERLRSMSLFIVFFIASTVIPGINFIILLGLPLLGLLESFFDMKKIGEKKNEDHS